MNIKELTDQLQFFKDIGVESLEVKSSLSASGKGLRSEAQGAALRGEAQARQGAASRDEAQARQGAASRDEAQARQGAAQREAPGEGSMPTKISAPTESSPATPTQGLEVIRAEIGDCQRCKLAPKRTNIVFGSGNPNAELVFVGEAPGFDEDQQGLPFVGRAGQLLTKIIESINLKREDVYICNVLKCRPPENRNPEPDEVASCNPFLKKQLATIRPKVVCCLGAFAAQTVIKTASPISRLRGQFFDIDDMRVIATFHPAYLLRSPEKKREVWEDMKQIRAELFRLRS